eukprot:4349248-Pleurochrysis_carterae.AAC.1
MASSRLRRASSERRALSESASRSLATTASPSRGLMFLARLAYLSELSVSSNWSCESAARKAQENSAVVTADAVDGKVLTTRSGSGRCSIEERYGTDGAEGYAGEPFTLVGRKDGSMKRAGRPSGSKGDMLQETASEGKRGE